MNERALKKIFEQAVRQRPEHDKNIRCIFKLLREAVENEFREDNAPTLDGFMLEIFEKSQSVYYKKKEEQPTPSQNKGLSRYDLCCKK
jgi:hypothetical protein